MTLVCDNLTLMFGGLTALNHVSLTLQPQKISAIIGPNGAGKTTLFNVLTGIYKPTSGQATWNGQSLLNLKPHEFAALGIARTFQNIRLFGDMSKRDHIVAALDLKTHASFGNILTHGRAHVDLEDNLRTRASHILKRFGFDPKQFDEPAQFLSYGKQRRLEIARAYATGAKVILLDEPAAGLNHHETDELIDSIKSLQNEGITIILIEHDMKLVMKISEHIFVLDHGELIASGSPVQIQSNPKVIEAYLGVEHD